MFSLSVVVITKNEEKNIGRCLESVADWALEVIVVDSHSTDRTGEIVSRFPNAKFVQTDWKGYSETKNFGNNMASGDFILSLDADESLDDVAKESVKKVLADPNAKNAAYEIPRLTNYCGSWIHHCGWRPDKQLRLFPREKGTWNGKVVHEKLQLDSGMNVVSLPGDILHHSYENVEDHIQRINTYSTLGAEQVLDKTQSFLLAKGVVNGWFRFWKQYLLKQGFRDGIPGFYICSITGFMVFLKYLKAHQFRRAQLKGQRV